MYEDITLDCIKPGQRGVVTNINSIGSIRRRFMDIGIIKGTQIECVGKSPMGDPSAFLIKGAVIAIRSEDSRGIVVKIYEK